MFVRSDALIQSVSYQRPQPFSAKNQAQGAEQSHATERPR